MEHRPTHPRDEVFAQQPRTNRSSVGDGAGYSNAQINKKSKKKFTQLHLDIGQKNFYSSTCKSCGFVYTAGDPEEERLHDVHHKDVLSLSAIRFKSIPSGCKRVADYKGSGGIYRLEHDPASPKSAMVSPFFWFVYLAFFLVFGDLLNVICTYHSAFIDG